VAAGESSGLASEFILFTPLLPVAKRAFDALSVRRFDSPADLQCLRVPSDDPHSLKSITGPLSKAELAGRWGDEKKFVLE